MVEVEDSLLNAFAFACLFFSGIYLIEVSFSFPLTGTLDLVFFHFGFDGIFLPPLNISSWLEMFCWSEKVRSDDFCKTETDTDSFSFLLLLTLGISMAGTLGFAF